MGIIDFINSKECEKPASEVLSLVISHIMCAKNLFNKTVTEWHLRATFCVFFLVNAHEITKSKHMCTD